MAYDDSIITNQIKLNLEEREMDIQQHTSASGYAIGIPVGLGLVGLEEFQIPGMVKG